MRKISKLLSVILALVLAFGLISCGTGGDNSGSSEPSDKLKITFQNESLTMDEWDTMKIGVTVSDGSGVNVTVDDSTIAYLRGSKLTALKAGETDLTAVSVKDPSVTAKMHVTVNAKAENRPALSVDGRDKLAIGVSEKYTAVLSNADANAYTVSWKVSDTSKASITKDGTLTAKASGEVKVIATTVYGTVEFKAEKTVRIDQEVKVIFPTGVNEIKLAVSEIKEISGDYALEIAGKTYVADSDGYVTLNAADFDTSASNSFDGKITQGQSVHQFKLIVYKLDAPKAYQNGKALTADENGYFKVDKEQAADEDGLRWVTFDSAKVMGQIGYDQLRLTLKFDKFCELYSGMVHPNISTYHYSFGYKYTEISTGEEVWLFWDNNYEGQAYGGAMKPAYGAPYGYGYLKIYDASGNLLLDYYRHQITDGSGTHGNWSKYISSLETGKEYTFVLDTSETGDISFSGIDDATITKIEWVKKVETEVSFEQTAITVDEWTETALNAKTNDGSQITYTVDDPDVLYLDGGKIVGLKAGTAVVTATANGKEATLNVTVSANEAKRPVLTINAPAEIEIPETAKVTATLKCGDNEIASDKYSLTIESSNSEVLAVAGGSLVSIAAGKADISATATYCGKTFTAQSVEVEVKEAAAPVDNSVGKLYQGGEALTPAEDGSYVMSAEIADKTLTVDPYETKKAQGYKKLRITAKFSAFNDANVALTYGGSYSFGYSFVNADKKTTYVGWYNNHDAQAYVGAFIEFNTPNAYAYLKVYNADGVKIFEHYDFNGWSSTKIDGGCGYIPSLLTDTEYIFEIDTEKTGDITLYGFNYATVTKIEWLDMKSTKVSFKQQEYTAEEWTAFNVVAITNDGSEITYTVDDEEVLFIAGNKIVGLKAGEAIVTATANGVSATAKVIITENAANKPVLTINANAELEVLEALTVNVEFKSNGTEIPAADYAVVVVADNENVTVSGLKISGAAAGSSKITVTVTYCDVEFKGEFTVTVTATEDPTVGKVYNNGKQLVANESGVYTVAGDSLVADENGLYWLTFDDSKASTYPYLRFKVKFASFAGLKTNFVAGATYDYSFGYKYGSIHAFWDNVYSNGYLGPIGPDGGAGNITYFNAYTADGTKVVDAMGKSGWIYYANGGKFAENTEYVFEFKADSMSGFTFTGLSGMEISEITWADSLLA